MTVLNGQSADVPNTHPTSPVASPQSQQVGLVVGVIALICAFAFPIAGAIIGAVAVAEARKGGYRNPLALAALILGAVLTVLTIVIVTVAIVFSVNLIAEVATVCQGDATEGTFWGIPYTCN